MTHTVMKMFNILNMPIEVELMKSYDLYVVVSVSQFCQDNTVEPCSFVLIFLEKIVRQPRQVLEFQTLQESR